MKLYETLENQLKKENDFVTDENKLKKWVVIGKARNYDSTLIKLLLESKTLKEKFFVKVERTLVFKQEEFITFMEMKNYLNDSYTQYKNKVGLTIDGKYIKQRNEVALVWPFKDCVLEGGQSREEDKREEIFFNEILAQDEITQLFEPKVLTNAKVYDKEGEYEFKDFTRDAELNKKRGLPENTITDNLIIKSNNLLALHSLKKEFAGKVKLIYIDPPYNTGNDGFNYNDSFSHASWLTFIKNRLIISKKILKPDGVIFISCDDNEQAYLKLLLDEIFGRENEIGVFVWRKKAGAGSDSKLFFRQHEYILFYAKDRSKIKELYQPLNSKQKKEYKNPDNDPRGNWAPTDLTAPAHDNDPKRIYEIISPSGKVFKRCWSYTRENMNKLMQDNLIYFGEKGNNMPKRKRFLKDKKGLVPRSWIDDILTSDGKKDLNNLNLNGKFSYPKPLNLLKKFIEIASDENDIVLDFFAGSGTTAQAANELNRKFILVEQMEYVNKITLLRAVKSLKNSSLIYFELKKYNQTFIECIEQSKNTDELLAVWEQMKAKSFLNYNVDIKKQNDHIKEFKQLNIDEQKQHLIKILDKNQLYVNLSSLNDKDFECTEKDKQLTTSFYKLN
jgi:adenine-specific DNA-methyltransferase